MDRLRVKMWRRPRKVVGEAEIRHLLLVVEHALLVEGRPVGVSLARALAFLVGWVFRLLILSFAPLCYRWGCSPPSGRRSAPKLP